MDSENFRNSCLFLGIVGMNLISSIKSNNIEKKFNNTKVHKIPHNLSVTSDISIGATASIDINLDYDNFCDTGKLFLDTIHYTSIFIGGTIMVFGTYHIAVKPLIEN